MKMNSGKLNRLIWMILWVLVLAASTVLAELPEKTPIRTPEALKKIPDQPRPPASTK